jgi:hypothetical protein
MRILSQCSHLISTTVTFSDSFILAVMVRNFDRLFVVLSPLFNLLYLFPILNYYHNNGHFISNPQCHVTYPLLDQFLFFSQLFFFVGLFFTFFFLYCALLFTNFHDDIIIFNSLLEKFQLVNSLVSLTPWSTDSDDFLLPPSPSF